MDKRGDRFFPSCKYLSHAGSRLQCRMEPPITCQPLEVRIPHPGITRETPRNGDQMQCHLYWVERIAVGNVHLHTATLVSGVVGYGRSEYSLSKAHTWQVEFIQCLC